MGYESLRRQYDPTGAMKMVPDEAFLTYVADHDKAGANPPQAGSGERPTSRPSEAPAVPATPAEIFMAPAKAVYGAGKALVEDAVNYPRARLVDPAAMLLRNAKSMTPEEKARDQNARAFEVGTVLGEPAAKVAGATVGRLPGILGRLLTHGTAGAAVGGADAGIRNNSLAAVPAGMGAGALMGGTVGEVAHRFGPSKAPAPAPPATDTETGQAFFNAFPDLYAQVKAGKLDPAEAIHKGLGMGVITDPAIHEQLTKDLAAHAGVSVPKPDVIPPVREGALARMHDLSTTGVTPKGGGSALEDIAPDRPMLQNPASKLARSPLGPLLSSVTDRTRALGPEGVAIDDMIEKVVKQSQREPGQYLQPFDEALHKIAGRKGKLPEDARSILRAALQGKIKPESVPENLRPLYDQMKAYFSATPARATEIGALKKQGGKMVPFAQDLPEHYFPQRPVTVDEIVKDADLRSSMERNLQEMGLAKSPGEASAILQDHIDFVKSKGKKGGQLAIRAMTGLNPEASPGALRHAVLNSRPPLREPASGLEHAREINSPFFDPRPEVVFGKHVVDTERGMAEIQHYGQDASNLTAQVAKLPTEDQRLAKHLIRTATESHEPGDPKLVKALAGLRNLQLSLFTPVTSIKNLSQRNNTLLTSDAGEFLKHGIVPTPEAKKIGALSGARAEGAHETLAQALGSQPGKMATWLKWIGFTPVERGNRDTAALTGLSEAMKNAKRQGVTLTPTEQSQAALDRSNKAQFRSHPKDLPDWFTSHPITRTAALFKSFDYQQTRLILDETVGRLTSKDPANVKRGIRNLGIVATVYPLVGEGINDIYSMVFRRESPQHVAQRTKEWIDDTAAVASGRMNPLEYANKYKSRYGADMVAGSAPGVGGSLLTAMQYGEGDKGGSLLRQSVGPAISRPYEAGQLLWDLGARQGKPKVQSGELPRVTGGQGREALRLGLGGVGSLIAPYLIPPSNAAGEGDSKSSKKSTKSAKAQGGTK